MAARDDEKGLDRTGRRVTLLPKPWAFDRGRPARSDNRWTIAAETPKLLVLQHVATGTSLRLRRSLVAHRSDRPAVLRLNVQVSWQEGRIELLPLPEDYWGVQ